MGSVRFRPCRGAADYEGIAALANITSAEEFGFTYAAETYADLFERALTAFDVTSILLAEAGGRIVGAGYGFWDGDKEGVERVLRTSVRVDPAWRGQGIEGVLLRAAQAAAIDHAATRPATSLPSVFRAFTPEAAIALVEVLKADGYQTTEWMHLMIRPNLEDPPDEALPAGIEVRPVRPEDGVTVLQALDEAMQDERSWLPSTPEGMTSTLADPVWGQTDVWQVAWEGDEVVGGVLGWINREPNPLSGRLRGATERIFTRRPWRGRGIAKALIGRNLRELARRGMEESALAVDTANPSGALALYERVGFRPDRTFLFMERPVGSGASASPG